MHILFACPRHDAQQWLPGLQAALPDVKFSVWDESGKPTGAQIALVWQPPASLFTHETGLKTIFNLGAGVDAILALPTLPRDVRIVRLEDAGMSAQMTEYVIHALTSITRNFGEYARRQSDHGWTTLDEVPRSQWSVGVLGLGVVGARVATTLAALEYPVAGWSRSQKTVEGVRTYCGKEGLADFLGATRVLVNVLPLTDETRNMIDGALLNQLQPGAIVINVGRGASLVEADLLAALESGQVRAAALDVFQTEPLPADHPFWSHPRVSITPHIAARTLREETIAQLAAKLSQIARGESISGVVQRDRGY